MLWVWCSCCWLAQLLVIYFLIQEFKYSISMQGERKSNNVQFVWWSQSLCVCVCVLVSEKERNEREIGTIKMIVKCSGLWKIIVNHKITNFEPKSKFGITWRHAVQSLIETCPQLSYMTAIIGKSTWLNENSLNHYWN